MGVMSKSKSNGRHIMSYKILPPRSNISLMAGAAGPGLLVVLLLLLMCHHIPSSYGYTNMSAPYNLSSPACNANINGEYYCNVELGEDDAETLLEEVERMIIGESLVPSGLGSGRYVTYPALTPDRAWSKRPAKANNRAYRPRCGSNSHCGNYGGGGI